MKKTGRIEIVAGTSGPVVELSDIKEFCYVSIDLDDALLAKMETAAVAKCEAYLRRPLLVRDSNIWFDSGVSGTISTPFGKLNSVESITTYDSADQPTVVDSSSYIVDTTEDQQGRVCMTTPAYGSRRINSVSIAIKNGYADAAAVPQLLKEGIKSLVSYWYENREMYLDSKMPKGIKTKLNPYRIVRL